VSSIVSWRIASYGFPMPRVLGDVRCRFDVLPVGTVELESSTGETGVGFFWSPAFPDPAPPAAELERVFRTSVAPAIVGQQADILLNRMRLGSGHDHGAAPFADAVDLALWDIVARERGLPLHALLGSRSSAIPAYASGLDYHVATADAAAFFEDAARNGVTAFKTKVGYPDAAAEVERLATIRAAIGPQAALIVDANEAWTPKEATRRLPRYAETGIDVFAIEDPCGRNDFAGLAAIARQSPSVHVQAGEYLDAPARMGLLDAKSVDVLNLPDGVSEAVLVARHAYRRGAAVAAENTAFDVGVHVALALPRVAYLEWSALGYERFAESPVTLKHGMACAPPGPGHGIRLSTAAEEHRVE